MQPGGAEGPEPRETSPISNTLTWKPDSARLRLAVPKKGRVAEKVLELLQGCDIQYSRSGRLDVAPCKNLDVDLYFLPAADIAMYVADGAVDLGITGQDIIAETGKPVKVEVELGIGSCQLCLQWASKDPHGPVSEMVGRSVVTSFPNITRRYFDKLAGGPDHGTTIKYLHGSVEAACGMGLADCIVDLVETGETMRAAGLEIADKIMDSQMVMISCPGSKQGKMIEYLRKRVVGYQTATRYVYFVYNCPRASLPEAELITPGKKSPTVTSLEDPDWVAVSVLIKRTEVQRVMDRLEAIGGRDMLVWDLRNTRGFE